MSNEEIVRRYCRAVAERDLGTAEALRDPGWTCSWPQSGERVTSSLAMRAIAEHDPGGGSRDEAATTSLGPLLRLAGAGDTWTASWTSRSPDGSEWLVVDIVELKDGLVVRETTYWALPFAPPAWRRAWVELDHASMRPDDPLRDRIG